MKKAPFGTSWCICSINPSIKFRSWLLNLQNFKVVEDGLFFFTNSHGGFLSKNRRPLFMDSMEGKVDQVVNVDWYLLLPTLAFLLGIKWMCFLTLTYLQKFFIASLETNQKTTNHCFKSPLEKLMLGWKMILCLKGEANSFRCDMSLFCCLRQISASRVHQINRFPRPMGPPQMVVKSKRNGTPAISGISRLVKCYTRIVFSDTPTNSDCIFF